MAVDPDEYFELSMDELREVARFAVLGAQEVLGTFERALPGDPRPRAAVDAAWEFANGARRTNLQRTTAFDAHRAAKDAPTPALVGVLKRYPAAVGGRSRVSILMKALDDELRMR